MKILLEAPILTQSGYGEHARLVFKALQSQPGVEIYTNPLNWGQTSWLSKFDQTRRDIDETINNFQAAHRLAAAGQEVSFDMQIHVGIPNEFQKKAQYSICVTAGIETDRVSSNWIIKTHREIDKLIVPSEHSKSSFVNTAYEAIDKEQNVKTILKCGCPVDVVPYPVKDVEPKHIGMSLSTEFNFLSVALLGPRKNLENMIKWFVEEFKDDNVGLVLKTGKSTGSNLDFNHVRKHLKHVLSSLDKNRKCKVYLLHGDLTEEEIHSLYVRGDLHAYVTTTHGEGYGLPIFEAAYSGMPIIATNWSGHLDFLEGEIKENNKMKNKKLFAKVDYEMKEIPKNVVWKDILIEGAQWAVPSKSSFKKQIRKVYSNHGMYKKWARSLQEQMAIDFSEEKVIAKMKESIFSESSNSPMEQEEIMVL